MRNYLWAWLAAGATVIVITGYIVITYVNNTPSASYTDSVIHKTQLNPLLTADRAAISRWFPGFCFAEIYMKDPSLDGKSIPSCMRQVIQAIHNETEISITVNDIRTPEVFAHLKQIYGNHDR